MLILGSLTSPSSFQGTGVIPTPVKVSRQQQQIKVQEDWDCDVAMYQKNKGLALGSTVFDLLYQVLAIQYRDLYAALSTAPLPLNSLYKCMAAGGRPDRPARPGEGFPEHVGEPA